MAREVINKHELLFRAHLDFEWQELDSNGKGLTWLQGYARLYRSKGFEVKLSKVTITKEKTDVEF